MVPPDAAVVVKSRPRFVSRGGEKLDSALAAFGVDPTGRTVLDLGASTGGFTDCLLTRGAARVYALDVGYGQLAQRVRDDPRVVAMERVNARLGFELPEPVDLVVADVSFISSRLVLLPAFAHLKVGGQAVVLLKPQFEAGRKEVGKGGVVRDPLVHARVIGRFAAWAVGRGIRIRGLITSPIEGAAGNREFLVWLEPSSLNRVTTTYEGI